MALTLFRIMDLLAWTPAGDGALWPLAALGISLSTIVFLITTLRVHAFFALIFRPFSQVDFLELGRVSLELSPPLHSRSAVLGRNP